MTSVFKMSASMRAISRGLIKSTQARHYSSRNILKLHERGLLQDVFPETPELLKCLLESPQCMYCGFDPTADSLHIGNLLSVMVLIHCQRAGHHPIALIGGASGQIGDPSGRTKDRDALDLHQLENDAFSIKDSLQRIFTNHELFLWKEQKPLPPVRILDNAEWYKGRNVIEFLSAVGRHFRMGDMLSRRSVKSRLSRPEGMNFTEFSYQVFQAYDWLHLCNNYNCSIQIGGGDQIGNMHSGYELIQRIKRKNVYALTTPLITTTSGSKLGKSTGSAIWLNSKKTSAFELYQFFFNRPDSDVEKYLNWFTFFSEKEIEQLVKKHKKNPDKREAQKKLAECVTVLLHGENGLDLARRCTDVLFNDSVEALSSMTEQELVDLFKGASTTKLFLDPGTTVVDMVMKVIYNWENDAVRIIKEGGIYINHQRVTEPNAVLIPGEHILPNGVTVVRSGKKRYFIVKWVNANRVTI